MDFLNSILPTFQHLGVFGYWLVLLIALAESLVFVGEIIPGAVLVVLAGFLSAQGYLDLGELIWFAAIGAILGDGLSYWLGTKGTKLFKEESRWFKQTHLEKGEQFFKKHGGKSVFLGRFTGPLRPIIPFIAGLSKMDKWQFLLWNVSSGFLWAVAHLLLGYFFGGALTVIEAWSTRGGIFIVAIVIAVILIRFIVKYSRPFFAFLKSISISIKDAFTANPDIQKFVRRHPRFFAFAKRRLDASRFFGLPLTLLLIAFIYVFSGFVGTIQDVVTSDQLVAADIRVANLMYVFRDAELIKTFLWITLLAKWQMIVSFTIIASILLWLWKKRLYILPFWVTISGSYLFYTLSKIIIHRPRPDIAYYLETGYSFPSGHATMVVAFYGFLTYILFRQLKHWKTKANILIASLLIILSVGLSRVYLGVHYLSDVWGGYLLGALWLIIGISVAEWLKWRKPMAVASISRTVKTASVVLSLAGLMFYTGFALQYHPPIIRHGASSTTVVADVLTVFADKNVPRYTETLIGSKQEPLSFIVIAERDQNLLEAMQKGGWLLADPEGFASAAKLVNSVILKKDYLTAPMTPSFWNAKVHDFGFEKPTKAQSLRERHHARFWRTQFVTQDGKHIYVGTASKDIGLKWWLITHTIGPDIDTERELLFSDLGKTGLVERSRKIQFVAPVLGENFAGDQFFTDGKLYIIVLK